MAALRRLLGKWGLIIALLALPAYYGVRDLTHGYGAGFVAGHHVVQHERRLRGEGRCTRQHEARAEEIAATLRERCRSI